MNLNQNTAHKLRTLALDVESRANEYGTFSREEEWQTRAGQLDRAAALLNEAAQILGDALVEREPTS